ncbi:MAG: DNA polymerase III subunit beta [Candidatus Hydrogenedentes bacterium]|nr:DNA polymerase III subunit beta [Candidatus Hydrogenedentota bacterium]
MRIRIARQDLLDAVNKVKSVVSARSALPILSHIFMEAAEGRVRLCTTDLKVSIECSVDCAVEEPGSLTVSCQRLASILSELPNAEIKMELGESNVVGLECGRIDTRLFSMSPEEFPPIRSFEDVEPLTFSQVLLKRLFTRTSFAICGDQARYNLTGLLFEIADGKLVVVATDGRRMSLCIEQDEIPSGINIRVIIPGKMVVELERLLTDEGSVKVYIDETQAAFAFNSVRVVTALIEGTFPNYEMVIPKKHDKEVVLETGSFQEAVRRTRTMTNEKFNSVRLSLNSGLLTLKVVTPDVGEYKEDMIADFDGSNIEIAFNPDFILDVLRHIDSEKVCLTLKDAVSPGLLKPYNPNQNETYVNVIMPIRI